MGRPEAHDVISRIKAKKIDLLMLTGDVESSSLNIGNAIGLDPKYILSGLLPEDKLDFVKKLKQNESANHGGNNTSFSNPFRKQKEDRIILMCGDGINDSLALTAADVGVAMGHGAAMAMEISDVTLMDSDLNKLTYALDMGKRVNQTIVQNIVFALSTKVIVMGLTFCGKMSLMGAVASDVGGLLIVTLNGLKLIPTAKKSKVFRTENTNTLSLSDDPSNNKSYEMVNQQRHKKKRDMLLIFSKNLDYVHHQLFLLPIVL